MIGRVFAGFQWLFQFGIVRTICYLTLTKLNYDNIGMCTFTNDHDIGERESASHWREITPGGQEEYASSIGCILVIKIQIYSAATNNIHIGCLRKHVLQAIVPMLRWFIGDRFSRVSFRRPLPDTQYQRYNYIQDTKYPRCPGLKSPLGIYASARR